MTKPHTQMPNLPCETLTIYNLNMWICKLPCKHKIESRKISMSDGNREKK